MCGCLMVSDRQIDLFRFFKIVVGKLADSHVVIVKTWPRGSKEGCRAVLCRVN